MKFPALFRNTLLLSGLLVLGLASAVAADWPRQVTDSRGVHTLESKPTRIVSTSVTLTGSLLAIDAPVVASGATTGLHQRRGDTHYLGKLILFELRFRADSFHIGHLKSRNTSWGYKTPFDGYGFVNTLDQVVKEFFSHFFPLASWEACSIPSTAFFNWFFSALVRLSFSFLG